MRILLRILKTTQAVTLFFPVFRKPGASRPREEGAAKALKARTLTNLYKARPQWLAVAAAYGWEADISEEDALGALLALNLAEGGS